MYTDNSKRISSYGYSYKCRITQIESRRLTCRTSSSSVGRSTISGLCFLKNSKEAANIMKAPKNSNDSTRPASQKYALHELTQQIILN